MLLGFVVRIWLAFLEGALLATDSMPMIGAARVAGASDEAYEVLDRVRRAKAAELTGKETINVDILVDNKLVASKEVPISSLVSPKPNISMTEQKDADRFMTTLQKTQSGSTPPNIQVTPGSNGTSIKDVGFE